MRSRPSDSPFSSVLKLPSVIACVRSDQHEAEDEREHDREPGGLELDDHLRQLGFFLSSLPSWSLSSCLSASALEVAQLLLQRRLGRGLVLLHVLQRGGGVGRLLELVLRGLERLLGGGLRLRGGLVDLLLCRGDRRGQFLDLQFLLLRLELLPAVSFRPPSSAIDFSLPSSFS